MYISKDAINTQKHQISECLLFFFFMYFLLWNLKVADIKILTELSWWKCGVEGEETELQMQVDLTSSESLCSVVLPFGNKSNCW